jgi:hypothetical protein
MVFMNNAAGPGMSFNATVKADGSFSIANVTPGEYVIRATALGGTAQSEMAMARVVIDNADVTDVRLVTAKPTKVTGRIAIDPQATKQPPSLAAVRVSGFPVENEAMGMGVTAPGSVAADLTFELRVMPNRIAFSAVLLPAGWAQKGVRFNDRDVTDSGVNVGVDPVAGVEIVITDVVGELSGRVLDANGQPVRGAWVVVFTQDRARWRQPFRYAQQGRMGATNEYKVPIVQGGALYAVALESIEPGETMDPAFLERMIDRATRIDLGDGEKKRLDLTVSKP